MARERTAAPLARPLAPIPQHLATIMAPELPSLCAEIDAEIRAGVPEYAAAPPGYLDEVLRLAVERNVSAFVERVAVRTPAHSEFEELCRRLGRIEADEGRSLDSLQTAFRIGVRVAWRRTMHVGGRYGLPARVMSLIADGMFAYVDEMCTLSREGFQAAQAQLFEQRDDHRRRLHRALLAGRHPGELPRLAERADWELGRPIAAVAVDPGPQLDLRPSGSTLGALDALQDAESPSPCLLVHGPVSVTDRRRLAELLHGRPAAIGPPVEPAQVRDSLRWARQGLDLQRRGVLADALVDVDEHLLTLWLHADDALTQRLIRRQLEPLDGLPEGWRERLIETLHARLSTGAAAAQLAAQLGVHPQTVRYRIRVIDQAFGDRLDDPAWRIATELALRVRQDERTRTS